MDLDSHATAATKQPKTGVMRAAMIASPGRVEMVETEIPQPVGTQVLVRVEGCGVCASNLEFWTGQPWFTYPAAPGAPGHEGWGNVEAVGEDVQNVRVGERVAMLSDKAYAEYDLTDESKLMHLPDSLAYQDVPAEPLGCAMNIFRRSEIKAGQDVAIVGVGFLGALVTQMAAEAGANVIAIARRPFALHIARESGAAHLVEMTDRNAAVEQVKKLTDDAGCDVVIEATGKQGPLDLASDISKERGRLVIAGYHQDGSRQINMQLWNWKGLDVINAHERDPQVYLSGMKGAIDAISTGRLAASRLYTHSFALDELDKALDMTLQRPEGFMKALIKL